VVKGEVNCRRLNRIYGIIIKYNVRELRSVALCVCE